MGESWLACQCSTCPSPALVVPLCVDIALRRTGVAWDRNENAGHVFASAQIEFLEVRLAEVMAYADIPINMRPALTELSSGSMSALAAVGTAGQHGSHAANLQHLFSGLSSQTDGSDSSRGAAAASATAGVVGGIKATQVELVRGALLGCLKMLRQMSEALGEGTVEGAKSNVRDLSSWHVSAGVCGGHAVVGASNWCCTFMQKTQRVWSFHTGYTVIQTLTLPDSHLVNEKWTGSA